MKDEKSHLAYEYIIMTYYTNGIYTVRGCNAPRKAESFSKMQIGYLKHTIIKNHP